MKNEECIECWGSGWETQFVTPCKACKGTGKALNSYRNQGEAGTENSTSVIEMKVHWSELSVQQQRHVIAAHHKAFNDAGVKGSLETMERIFNLGNPFIVWGDGENPSCRIAEESQSVMKVIIREYFK